MNTSMRRLGALVGILVFLCGGTITHAQAPVTPTLVAIRAAHHATPGPGFDRVVFEFRGPLPERVTVDYVPQLIGDGSGLPISIAGNAILQVVVFPAVAHTEAGSPTAPGRLTYALPNVIQVVRSGDFEAVVSHGIGLARRTTYTVTKLRNPSRVVIDIATPFRTVTVRDYFVNQRDFNQGREPYVQAVTRPVIPPATATGALQRLFAGPTAQEAARGLVFINSKATGFTGLRITNGVAHVRLTGGCSSGGSTLTIANEIIPTLKQFSTVRYVKIYDPSGRTQRPAGNSDSIPACLEP